VAVAVRERLDRLSHDDHSAAARRAQRIAEIATDEAVISAGTYLEKAIVVDANRDPVLSGRLNDLLAVTRIRIESVTERHTAASGAIGQDRPPPLPRSGP